MRKEYDFSIAPKNPYASMLKKPITIRLDEDSVNYFTTISEEVGIPIELTAYSPDFAFQMDAAEDIMRENRNVLKKLAQ